MRLADKQTDEKSASVSADSKKFMNTSLSQVEYSDPLGIMGLN